ncbi:PAS domain-containing protein [Parasedimentitalea psychrophila]|uniref:PAS domain-containing protein n=1 Tax=Parasedimentitalea psychrophila TaxID=2997337 RepID=A0A9Y2P6D7_9RHOB|nr:PAS domain-containing protein [Parasedimentitalea psychrophila]WIY24570.1 PAS domain-containing protein [Parasedimentitalea psychrophila]
MSYHDRRQEFRPATGEAPFGLDEVFFSRTDSRGIIQAYNHVFQRVANYEAEDLLGKPHKIIRHPDMPRGVFYLFWDALKSGQTIGAYVKNKAADGLYYWVFAVVVPCEDGFLSARIKPSSPLFDTIIAEYTTLLEAEQHEGLCPEDSAVQLLGRLQDLGFEDYVSFATHALAEELNARDSGLGAAADPKIKEFRNMLKNARDLVQETEALVQEFDAMRTIPHNMRVIASRIEPAGGPVTVLSQNYGAMSRDMSEWFADHVLGEESNFSAIKDTVNNGLFIECMARILTECDVQLQKEPSDIQGINMQEELKALGKLVTGQRDLARRGLTEVKLETDRILTACKVMHRHFLGLSLTRVLCKIESARMSTEGQALTAIITQLGVFQGRISSQLNRIIALATAIQKVKL